MAPRLAPGSPFPEAYRPLPVPHHRMVQELEAWEFLGENQLCATVSMLKMRRLRLSMVYLRGLATGADCAEFRDVLAMSRRASWFTDIYLMASDFNSAELYRVRIILICGFARQGFRGLLSLWLNLGKYMYSNVHMYMHSTITSRVYIPPTGFCNRERRLLPSKYRRYPYIHRTVHELATWRVICIPIRSICIYDTYIHSRMTSVPPVAYENIIIIYPIGL